MERRCFLLLGSCTAATGLLPPIPTSTTAATTAVRVPLFEDKVVDTIYHIDVFKTLPSRSMLTFVTAHPDLSTKPVRST